MSMTGLPVILGKMEWMSIRMGCMSLHQLLERWMDVKFVFTMPTGRNLECIYLWNVDMYENWKEILGLDA